MKKRIVIFLLCCVAFFTAASFAKQNSESLDQLIAVVNDDVITKSELNHALSMVKMQITQDHLSLPPVAVLQKQVLDQLINKKLQLQVAKQAGIEVGDADIDQMVARVAKQNNMTVAMLYQRLGSEGMSMADYRHELRTSLTIQRLQQQEVVNRITISKEEVSNFMRSQTWQFNSSKEYHLEDILIPVSDAPSAEEISAAKKRAVIAIAKLHQGKSFHEVAQSDSGDAHALQGGDLGWRKLPEVPSAFADQVAHMEANEIVGPIQTPNGFHVIRLVAARRAATEQAAPDRKQIENLLLQRKFEEAVQNWVSKLRHQAFIHISSANA